MTELFERLKKNHEDPTGCAMARLIAGLDEETREMMVGVLKNAAVSNALIYSELKIAGFKIAKDTLSHHRSRVLGTKGKTWCHCPDLKETNELT